MTQRSSSPSSEAVQTTASIVGQLHDHTPRGERSLQDRVAVLTGAKGGIGQVLARGLAAEGVRMALVDLPGSDVADVAAACNALCNSEQPTKSLAVEADITDPAQVEALVERIAQHFGRLDFVINCAGIYHKNRLLDTSDAMFGKMLDVNVKAPFYLSKYALPHLRKSDNPTFINISSIAGMRPIVNEGAYCVTKAALSMMSNVLFAEHRAERIKSTAFCPGPAHTQMAEGRGFDVSKMLQPLTLRDAILAVLALPSTACVPNLEIVPTQNPSTPTSGY